MCGKVVNRYPSLIECWIDDVDALLILPQNSYTVYSLLMSLQFKKKNKN